jgi:single-strand DNA-binding protein
MADLNRIQLIGNLGQDPESRYTPTGRHLARFTLAINRRWKTSDGEEKGATDWFNIECWNGLGEATTTYLHKGRKVFIEGRLQIDQYEKDGQINQYVKVVASNVIFLDNPGNVEKPDETALEDVPF